MTTVFQVIITCMQELKICLSACKFDFWNGDSTKDFWSFLCTFCGGWIVFSAMYKRWRTDGKGWNG